jgi:hypothetical protein
MLEYLKELMESGAFKPLMERTNPLGQIVSTYR